MYVQYSSVGGDSEARKLLSKVYNVYNNDFSKDRLRCSLKTLRKLKTNRLIDLLGTRKGNAYHQ